MWRIIDNRKERILEDKFETEEKAIDIMNKLIAIAIGCYDFDVDYIEDDNWTYQDWYNYNHTDD